MKFVKAKNFTAGRDSSIDLIVIHTMETPEQTSRAESVASWFAGASAPQASAHYCIDADSVVQCVKDSDIAWHAPGANHDGIGFEHAGEAKQTGREWGDEFSTAMLDRSAALAAEKCAAYGIPVVWLSVSDLRAGRRGITSHNNVSKAFGSSSHWDPGSGFPIQRYLRLVRRKFAEGGGADEGAPLKADPPDMGRGDSGWRVKRIQRRLELHGYDIGEVDGDFGATTEMAVRKFQKNKDLDVDGIVGAMTWKMLMKAKDE
jgi:N-acetyl-anhydromuramyl-L-alanine amidase AmpD